jgi:hypothetical protein
MSPSPAQVRTPRLTLAAAAILTIIIIVLVAIRDAIAWFAAFLVAGLFLSLVLWPLLPEWFQSRSWPAGAQCPGCGYDWSGLRSGSPCPECGHLR